MPVSDKVGQVFGKLTVVKLSEKRNPTNGKILWECKCSCGNPEIIYATTGNLTQGYKTSCGCAKQEGVLKNSASRRKDLTNQVFGKLTALYYIENTSPPLWHCRCSCGAELDVTSRALTHKERTSCGCKRRDLRKDLTGQKFGKLTVVERAENYTAPSGQTQIQYKCKCDCGNEIIVMATSLKQGLTSSCGCVKSAGELAVARYLAEKSIKFEQQYKFADCRDVRPLPFDFCIQKENGEIWFLIEINGKHHYEPRFSSDPELSNEIFKKQQEHDQIKEVYCLEHGFDLLTIPYYELSRYKEILDERLSKE